jgi:hypothetical protein
MNNRSYLLGGTSLLLVLIALGYSVYMSRSAPAEVAHVTTDSAPATSTIEVAPAPTPPQAPEAMITVDAPVSGTTAKSPLTISGSARGSWYFEASFPVVLVDANGVTLAQTPAAAQGEWMTENFVPFAATLTWASTSTTATSGMLIFKRDNPSGLPEHDAQITVPVVFAL